MKAKHLLLRALLACALPAGAMIISQPWLIAPRAQNPDLVMSLVAHPNSKQTFSPVVTADSPVNSPDDIGVARLIAKLASAQTKQQKFQLCEALVRMGTDESMQAFVNAALTDRDKDSRIEMLRAFDEINTPAALELTTSILAITDDPAAVAAVTRTIARMATADTVQFLGELYTETESIPGQRQRVVEALAAIHSAPAVRAQIAFLNSTQYDELGFASIQSLADMGTEESLAGLVDAFDHLAFERFAERQIIVENLSHVSNLQSAPYLDRLSKESSQPLIQEAARLALASMQVVAIADARGISGSTSAQR